MHWLRYDNTIRVVLTILSFSFLRGNPWQSKKVALVIGVEEVETSDSQKKKLCTLSDSDGTLSDVGPSIILWEMDKLRPYEGTMDFYVRCMNVQGGGILSHDTFPPPRTSTEKFSLKWLDLVTEKVGEPDRFHKGCWYFDPTQQQLDLASMANDSRVQQLRHDNIKMIEDDETRMLKNKELRKIIFRMLFARLKEEISDDALNIVPFQYALLSVPFLVYIDIVMYFLAVYQGEHPDGPEGYQSVEDLSDDDWCLIFYSLVKIGMHLRKDEEWHKSNAKFEAHVKSVHESQGETEFNINETMEELLYNLTSKVGEWFEECDEFRAAIWCYTHNLALCRNLDVPVPPEARDRVLVDQLNYIALANKRMDNFVDAYRYYEEAIVAHSVGSESQQPLIDNAKVLQRDSKDWFGTNGRITSWESSKDIIATRKCPTCDAEGAAKKCSACHLVCYCDLDCQRGHWKKVHKYTCLGKLRGK